MAPPGGRRLRTVLVLAVLLALPLAPGVADATHPCFGPDCGIPHAFPPDLSECRPLPSTLAGAWSCLKGVLS